MGDPLELIHEGRVFARYLIGREPSEEVLARYSFGVGKLALAPSDPGDAGLLAFAARRPWALPLLDAAAGFLRPRSVLRRRLLLMSAILETTIENADLYLPQVRGWISLTAVLVVRGTTAVLKALAGAPLLILAVRNRP